MSLFGQNSGSSLFGQQNQQQQQQQQQQNPSPFGTNVSNTQQKPNLFGSLNTNTAASLPQQGGGLFGSNTQPAQSNSLFGNAQPQQNSGGGLFGSTQNQQAGGGLFGSSQPAAQTGGLFGSSQPQQQQAGGLIGSSQSQPQQQQQQQQGNGLFGSLGATNQQSQQQQQQQQQQPQPNGQQQQQVGLLGQSRLFSQSELAPRTKPVTEQIELAFAKWNPLSPVTPFRTYLYNAVPENSVPFYGPTAADDEAEWEEALAKRPIPGSVPIIVRGFQELGERMKSQYLSLEILRGRLHEINEGLNTLLQKHDLQISIRAAECRRKHQRLARQCLQLASKTQVLRNRGFAMDSTEETLRQKLLVLEKGVLDPALNGRSEEIWARMVSIRERGRQLQREFERAGRGLKEENEGVMDEEVMKRAKKILEDYSSQLAHLAKELAQMQQDWAEWETAR